MTARTDPGSPSSALVGRARGFWAYYRRYTTTAIHAAATATMTAFGLLLFIDPWFALLAIAAYVLPPVILYATGHDAERPGAASRPEEDGEPVAASSGDREPTGDVGRDADADGIDVDRDGPDRDYDGPDRDFDGVDRDADGPDLDHDGLDRDHDGPDHDSDGTDADFDGRDGDSDADLDRDG